MSFARKLFSVTAPLALLAVGGCATGLPTQVSRFQAMPAPVGQTFAIEAASRENSGGRANSGGLEFSRYADMVGRALVAQGYTPAASPAQASLIVSLDYGVDDGRTEVRSSPGFGGFGGGFGRFGGGFGFGGFGRFGYPYYSRFGYGGLRSPFYYGWNDPFLFDGFGGYNDVRSYTVYTSYVDLDIRRRDGQAVFEGTAKARSRTDELPKLVPNLVEAIFTGFPGRSGETVRITVPSAPRERS